MINLLWSTLTHTLNTGNKYILLHESNKLTIAVLQANEYLSIYCAVPAIRVSNVI